MLISNLHDYIYSNCYSILFFLVALATEYPETLMLGLEIRIKVIALSAVDTKQLLDEAEHDI